MDFDCSTRQRMEERKQRTVFKCMCEEVKNREH